MLARSHVIVAFGCIVAYKAGTSGDLAAQPLDYIVGGVAALLPDIDDNRSYIGSRFAPVAFPIRMIFGHRGITHSLLMLGILGGLVYFFGNDFGWMIPFVIGYASHLLADYVTNTGIPLFYPYSRRYRFVVTFGTGTWVEYVVVFLLSLGITIFALVFQSTSLLEQLKESDPVVHGVILEFLGNFARSANL